MFIILGEGGGGLEHLLWEVEILHAPATATDGSLSSLLVISVISAKHILMLSMAQDAMWVEQHWGL